MHTFMSRKQGGRKMEIKKNLLDTTDPASLHCRKGVEVLSSESQGREFLLPKHDSCGESVTSSDASLSLGAACAFLSWPLCRDDSSRPLAALLLPVHSCPGQGGGLVKAGEGRL